MKKFLIIVGFLLISINQVSALNCVDLKSNLKRYNESSDVLALQNFLAEKGFLNAKPNGYFGNGTLLAVKKYQKSIGLSQSGQVFPLTRATIKKETCDSSSSFVSNTGKQTTNIVSTSPVLVGTYTAGTNPYGLTIIPNTNNIWVTNYNSGNVSKIDMTTGNVIGTYAVGNNPIQSVYDVVTGSLWVANRGSNSVSKINPSTGGVIGTYAVGINPSSIAFDKHTKSIWVANRGSNSVTKINASNGTVIGTYNVGSNPVAVEFESVTNSVWVVNNGSSSVMKLNASNGSIVGTYSVGSYPDAITFDSHTNSIWVANYSSNNVTKLNPASGAVVGTYMVGTNPTGITFDPYTKSIWVTNRGSNNISNINSVNGTNIATYVVGSNPNSVVVTSDSLWVSNYTSNNVIKFSTQKSVTTAKPVITPTPVVVTPSTPLTSNQKRQQDVINLLTAMYNFYLDSNGTFPVTYVTVVPVELCALGISECDKLVEIKSSLVPKFLSRIPTDPTITSTSSIGSGYFITRSLYGDIKITALKSDSKEDIFAVCNFSIKCKITTAKDVSTVLGKPNIDSISKTTFLSGGVMSIPLTINGTNFSSSSNIVSLIHQNNRKVFNLGTYPSATGTIIIATSSFTNKAFPCGYGCSEIPSAGNYEVTVKTSSGESNVGYISLQGVNATSYSNGNDASFIPKSTHVKLGTVAISSSALLDIKGLNIRASSSPVNVVNLINVKNSLNSVYSTTTLPSLSTKISNYTLTDSLTGTVINGGPLFVLTNQRISNNQSKIYEIYANIAEIENVQAGQVIFSGEFVVEDNITQSKTNIPFPNFAISISY